MKYLRIILAMCASVIITPASAADVYTSTKDRPAYLMPSDTVAPTQTWTSIWVAALVGYTMSNTDLSLDVFREIKDEREEANLAKLSGFGGEGFDATMQLGGDVQIGRFVLGGWAEYSFGGIQSSASVFDGAAKLDVDQNDSYGLCGRAGVTSGDTLFYGAGCYIWTQVDAKLTLGKNSVTETFDFSGPAAEAGIEHRFTQNIRGKLSARYTWFDEETVASFGDESFGGNLTAEPGAWSVKAGVVINTN